MEPPCYQAMKTRRLTNSEVFGHVVNAFVSLLRCLVFLFGCSLLLTCATFFAILFFRGVCVLLREEAVMASGWMYYLL